MDELLLNLHRLFVLLWIVSVAGELFLSSTGRKLEEDLLTARTALLDKVSKAGRAAGGMMTLLGLGLVFVVGNYEITENWILLKIAMLVGAMAVGAVLNGKVYERIKDKPEDPRAVKDDYGQITRNSSIILGFAAIAVFSALTKLGAY
ncbi:MAG: hypothetical protein ACE5GM_07065 [bacterium]